MRDSQPPRSFILYSKEFPLNITKEKQEYCVRWTTNPFTFFAVYILLETQFRNIEVREKYDKQESIEWWTEIMTKVLNKGLLDKYKTIWAESSSKAGFDYVTPVSNDDNSLVWMIEHFDGIHGMKERGK
jgi:hypothetical protein